jgi:hypothetical protein
MITTTGTETTEGFIPHLDHNGQSIVVMTTRVSIGSAVNIPVVRESGRLCYALPGGGIHVGGKVSEVAQ